MSFFFLATWFRLRFGQNPSFHHLLPPQCSTYLCGAFAWPSFSQIGFGNWHLRSGILWDQVIVTQSEDNRLTARFVD